MTTPTPLGDPAAEIERLRVLVVRRTIKAEALHVAIVALFSETSFSIAKLTALIDRAEMAVRQGIDQGDYNMDSGEWRKPPCL